MKKALSILTAGCLAVSLAACGSTAASSAASAADSTASSAAESTAASDTAAADGQTYKVGICQLVQHAALDEATQGFQDKLYLGNLDARRDWGYAKDYIECMWLILQHDTPEDFVIATGEMHTVREFVTLAFREVGITLRWEGQGVDEKGIDTQTGKVLVEVDPKYFRPAEVEQLLGDPTKAKTLLGWNPRQTSFEELVRIMAEHDMKFVKKLYLRSKEL